MTNNELNKLKELAERAAPGPWVNAYKLTPMVDHVWSLGKEELIAKDLEENNAEYIAAVSPDVVLKLIAHISSLDEEVKSLRAEVKTLSVHKKLLFEENGRLLQEKEAGLWDVNHPLRAENLRLQELANRPVVMSGQTHLLLTEWEAKYNFVVALAQQNGRERDELRAQVSDLQSSVAAKDAALAEAREAIEWIERSEFLEDTKYKWSVFERIRAKARASLEKYK